MTSSLIGAAIGNYRIVAPLGEGGMGAVYLAEHPLIGKRVALKVLHPEFAGNPEAVTRFFHEARAVNEIGHPNIVDVIDFGQTNHGVVYLIMEYLEGRSLAQWLREEGALHPADATWVAEQVADALVASHARGIVHRDLKPDNVYIVPGHRPRIKVLDFGIAKLNGPTQASARTRAGVVLGTPAYMAPEQCEGRRDIDGRVDVYALGVMLFEMLTGQTPFLAEGFGEMLVQHLTVAAPTPSSRRPGLPSSLDAIVLRAMTKDPAQRFASMDEMRAALTDPAAFEAGVVPVVSAPEPVPMMTLAEPTPPSRPTTLSSAVGIITAQTPQPPRRGSRAAAATAVLGAIALAIGLFLATRPPPPPVVTRPVKAPVVVPVEPPVQTKQVVVEPPVVVVPAVETVVVRVTTETRGAVVFIDGKPRGSAGDAIVVPRGETAIEVSLKAPGHRTWTRSITPTADADVEAKMKPKRRIVPGTPDACANDPDCILEPK